MGDSTKSRGLRLEVSTPDRGTAMVEVRSPDSPVETVGTDDLDAALDHGTRARRAFAGRWRGSFPHDPSDPADADLAISDARRLLLSYLDLTRTARTGEAPTVAGFDHSAPSGASFAYAVGFGSRGFAGYVADVCKLPRLDPYDRPAVSVGPDPDDAVMWLRGIADVGGGSDMADVCCAVLDDLFGRILSVRVHVRFRDGSPVMVADDPFAALVAVMAMVLESDGVGTCRTCGNPMRVQRRGGRRKMHCSTACRQGYVRARRWWELVRVEGLGPDVAARVVRARTGTVADVVRRNLEDMESHVRGLAAERGIELPPTPEV